MTPQMGGDSGHTVSTRFLSLEYIHRQKKLQDGNWRLASSPKPHLRIGDTQGLLVLVSASSVGP